MASYKVLKGIDYPPNKRVEIGDTVSDLPTNSIAWLLKDEAIEDLNKPAKKAEVVVEAAPVETPVETPIPVSEEVTE